MARLTLYVPGLFTDLLATAGAADAGRWPALERLLARAAIQPAAGAAVENRLCAEFGFAVTGEWTPPVADLTAALDLGAADRAAGFMRVDPVHLRPDPAHLILFDARSLELGATEADHCIAVLNEGLAEHGVVIVRGAAPSRWYARVDGGADLRSFSGRAISGCPADLHMPDGSRASFLRRLMNDAQMLLYDSPTNRAREARGLPVVNSVWPWGAGTLPAPRGPCPDIAVGNDVLCAALARRRGCRWQRDAEDVGELLARAAPAAEVLVVFGAPNGALGDPAPAGVDELNRRWAEPLSRALRTGALTGLSIVTDHAAFAVSRWSIWRAWRRTRGLDMVRQGLQPVDSARATAAQRRV